MNGKVTGPRRESMPDILQVLLTPQPGAAFRLSQGTSFERENIYSDTDECISRDGKTHITTSKSQEPLQVVWRLSNLEDGGGTHL